jgi:peptidoglycan hydrolase-like amidase
MKVKITTQTNMEYYKCAKNTIVDVDLEDYVTCVVASEVGNVPLEACKA